MMCMKINVMKLKMTAVAKIEVVSIHMDLQELHAICKGRVQGVGFRATVRHYAKQLGINGTVRNLPDGSVEVYAQGTKSMLDQFIDRIKSKVGLIEVESMSVEFYSPQNQFQEFLVIH